MTRNTEEQRLADLLPTDPLRTARLMDVCAECRNKRGGAWRAVATWDIGGVSYNDLGSRWTEYNDFRVSPNASPFAASQGAIHEEVESNEREEGH
jgi:hypothetical protein